jgi:aerobic-type carbon monoxide dehydrogenase small subunit (CoxS/CutS family)
MASKELEPGAVPVSAESSSSETTGVGFSRRNFLKTVGAGPLAAGVLASGAEAQSGPRVLGPGAIPIELTINGKPYRVQIEPRVTLLDAIRDAAGLTGEKRVCDRGSCGACTVIVDGRALYACSMLAVEAVGANVRTVEGLAQGTVLHPVQQAFCDTDGLMCGFCTPGFVMSAVALLEKHPNPTPDEARHALDGNICRCGTYPRVLEAALKVAKEGRRG